MAEAAAAADAAGQVAASGTETSDSPTYPHLWFDDRGRPWIDDTNIKVIEVVLDHTASGMSPQQIHDEYPDLSLAQIHAALTYYFDHKQAMDDEIERQRREYETMRAEANAKSPLIQRLRAQGKLP
jgi:uncharacterized protein (DUF433 family)